MFARKIFWANSEPPDPLLTATPDDLLINDDLSQLDRVLQYSTSNIALQRLVHTKTIAETARLVGYDDTVEFIIPVQHKLCTDSETVIRELAEMSTDVSIGENKNKDSPMYCLTTKILLPILGTLLADRENEVRSAAGEALVGTARIIDPADLGQHILTIVVELAHDFDDDNLRVTAAGLFNDLAEILGEDLCRQFVLANMVSLGEDPSPKVRKAMALSIYKIAQTVGRPLSEERLLPTYICHTKDDKYRVRRACAEVSSIHLTEVTLRLATDSNKLVRNSALQHLGAFISTLRGDNLYIDEKLVSLYISTAGDDDADLREYSAFSDDRLDIRKTLACSFHEVAQILTPEQVETDLLEHMENLLLDVDKVWIYLVQHLHVLFSIISTERREEMLALLLRVLESSNELNWRLRNAFAAQLPSLIPLFPASTIFNSFLPLVIALIEKDPVFSVRATASSTISPLYASLSGEQRESHVKWICNLSTHANSSSRQMFIYIVQRLPYTMTEEDFSPTFSEPFVLLANDKVIGIRITLAQSLGGGRIYPQWFLELPDILTASAILRVDENAHVKGAMMRKSDITC